MKKFASTAVLSTFVATFALAAPAYAQFKPKSDKTQKVGKKTQQKSILTQLPGASIPGDQLKAIIGGLAQPNGFSNYEAPTLVGHRTLLVTLDMTELSELLNQQVRLNQRSRIRNAPRAGQYRIELQTRRSNEAFGASSQSVVAKATRSSNGSIMKVKAVLPQFNSQGDLDAEIDTADFNRNGYISGAHKYQAGQRVYYRWVVKNSRNQVAATSTEMSFSMPRPFTVAAMGDSFGSGEGAPERSKSNRLKPSSLIDVRGLGPDYDQSDKGFEAFGSWDHRPSHRSNKSGMMQGIKLFKAERPDVWIEYKHTAISSATMAPHIEDSDDPKKGGMTSPFMGEREIFVGTTALTVSAADGLIVTTEDPQIDKVQNWLRENVLTHADVVLMSIGGNDGGFGDIITAALFKPLNFGGIEQKIRAEVVQPGLDNVSELVEPFYDELDDYIRPQDIYWVNYPNLTKSSRGHPEGLMTHEQTLELMGTVTAAGIIGSALGSVIGFFSNPFPGPEDILAPIAGTVIGLDVSNASPAVLAASLNITDGDMEVAERIVTEDINPAIDGWCARDTRCEVIDIEDATVGIGADVSDPYYNTLINSYRINCGGLDCAIHPTETGYRQVYANPISEKLLESYLKIEKASGPDYDIPAIASLNRIQTKRRSKVLDTRKSQTKAWTYKDVLEEYSDVAPFPPGSKEEKEFLSLLRHYGGQDAVDAYVESVAQWASKDK